MTIGNSLNTTNLNSATNNIGATNLVGAATANNIGTGNGYASTNRIGNTNTGTTIIETAGNSVLTMQNNSASLSSGGGTASNGNSGSNALTGGGGYTTYATAQTVTSNNSIANTLLGAQYVNKINGNTLIDGNVYINGTLNYVSSTSAATTVVGTGLTGSTSAGTSVVNMGQQGYVVDAHGAITAGSTTQTTAALTVTNGNGNTHGFVVSETSATMSGGVHSTSLTMEDNRAVFSNSATGAPIKVTGVADGNTSWDAVNYRQLRNVQRGVAGVSAMSNIPQVDQNKTFAFGAGLGYFDSQAAIALGGSIRLAPSAVMKASVSTSTGSHTNTIVGAGVAVSW